MYNPVFPWQPGFAPTWAGRPRRLVEKERILWQWWRKAFGGRFEEYWFDVPLDGQPPREEILPGLAKTLPPKYQRLWKSLTSKRADVIGRNGFVYQIIEIRSDIKPQTIGELMVYNNLAIKEYPGLSFGRTIIIGDTVDDMLRATIEAEGMQLFTRNSATV